MNIFRYKISIAIRNNANCVPGIDTIGFWSELDVLHRINRQPTVRCTNASKSAPVRCRKKTMNKNISELYRNGDDMVKMYFRIASLNTGQKNHKKILKFRFLGCRVKSPKHNTLY